MPIFCVDTCLSALIKLKVELVAEERAHAHIHPLRKVNAGDVCRKKLAGWVTIMDMERRIHSLWVLVERCSRVHEVDLTLQSSVSICDLTSPLPVL